MRLNNGNRAHARVTGRISHLCYGWGRIENLVLYGFYIVYLYLNLDRGAYFVCFYR